MAQQPQDMNLANEADCKLLGYGGSVNRWIDVALDIVLSYIVFFLVVWVKYIVNQAVQGHVFKSKCAFCFLNKNCH